MVGGRGRGESPSLQLAALRGDVLTLQRWRSRMGTRDVLLQRMALRGDVDALRQLRDRHPNVTGHDEWPWDSPGDTPLHCAARAGDTATVEALLKAGLCPSETNDRRETPLEAAAAGGHIGTMRVLLRSGAECDSLVVLRTLWAAKDAPEVHVLAEAAPEEVRNAPAGPAWQAAWDGRDRALRALIAVGGDPDTPDPVGWTPLHRAAFKGHSSCVKVLLEGGASVNKLSPNGETALHTATSYNRVDCLRVLLDAGADPFVRNDHGATALHLAGLSGHKESFELLLRAQVHGADYISMDSASEYTSESSESSTSDSEDGRSASEGELEIIPEMDSEEDAEEYLEMETQADSEGESEINSGIQSEDEPETDFRDDDSYSSLPYSNSEEDIDLHAEI